MATLDTTQGKALIQSKVAWGVLITALGVFFPKLQVFSNEQTIDEAFTFVGYAIDFVGGIVTLYGRATATEQISGIIKK